MKIFKKKQVKNKRTKHIFLVGTLSRKYKMSVCLGCEKESEEDEEYEQCHKCLDIECDECEENMERRSGLPYFLVCPWWKDHLYRLRHDEI